MKKINETTIERAFRHVVTYISNNVPFIRNNLREVITFFLNNIQIKKPTVITVTAAKAPATRTSVRTRFTPI